MWMMLVVSYHLLTKADPEFAQTRGDGNRTFAAPLGPSSLETCSRACRGRSAVGRDFVLPNWKNDIVWGDGAT